MTLKAGVRILGVKPETVVAMQVADGVYRRAGQILTITSVVEGVHSRGSVHYQGLAFDCRTSDVPVAKIQGIVDKIRAGLGADFDVVLEADHVHIEWDPKESL